MMQRLRQIGMRRRWRIGLIAILGFAVAQVTLAAHQFSHDASTAEACSVCAQLDQFESAVSLAAHERTRYPAGVSPHPEAKEAASVVSLFAYASRAPPTIQLNTSRG